MTRQLYELKHPLYPHPDLLKYYQEHKIKYEPQQGSYDDAYKIWYQLVRADHDISGAPLRPIYREVSQIIRMKASGKEYLLYSENLYGQDHEYVTKPFFHQYGSYQKPGFRRYYNYDTKTANVVKSGPLETIYFIPYSAKTIDELYECGPDDMDIELLVNVGSKQYGSRGFYRYEEFRDMELEDLARVGRDGKGMFQTTTTKIPAGTMAAELYNISGPTGNFGASQQQSNLYKEFQEFQKWKLDNNNNKNVTAVQQTTTTTTIKEKDTTNTNNNKK
jgi:hypothetical protein